MELFVGPRGSGKTTAMVDWLLDPLAQKPRALIVGSESMARAVLAMTRHRDPSAVHRVLVVGGDMLARTRSYNPDMEWGVDEVDEVLARLLGVVPQVGAMTAQLSGPGSSPVSGLSGSSVRAWWMTDESKPLPKPPRFESLQEANDWLDRQEGGQEGPG